MKAHRNPILQVVESRVRQLSERFEESSTIEHKATKGSLREGYLKQFLADLVPNSIQLRSGFVTDCRGTDISPQIDLVGFDPASLPTISLNDFVTILPIESVRLSIEVKSILKNADLDQISFQQQVFRQMRLAFTANVRRALLTVNCAGIPQFVVSFETESSSGALKEWFNKEKSLRAICVVGKFLLLRDFRSDAVIQIDSGDGHCEVMHLLSALHWEVKLTQIEMREALKRKTPDGVHDFLPDIGSYLTFDVPYPGSDDAARQL